MLKGLKYLLTAKEKHPSFDGCFLFGCSNNHSFAVANMSDMNNRKNKISI
jgi:hypothetical protein